MRKRGKRIYFTVVAVIVVLSFIISACAAATPTPTKAPTPTKVPPTPTPEPLAKGKIVVAFYEEPLTMDHADTQPPERAMLRSVRESLVDRDPKTMDLVGSLAESWEQVQPDTWRFYLREGIEFRNGEPLNAEAAKYSLDRHADPEAAHKNLFFNTFVKEVNVVDDYTVDIVTTEVDPIQPLRLVFWAIEAPKWMQDNPDSLTLEALGTGPYEMVEWVKGQYFRMTADENYWGEPKPTIKDVEIVFRGEPAVRAAGVATGEFDMGVQLTPETCGGINCIAVTAADTPIIRLNTLHPVLKDKRVRQAMSYAVDREAIADTLYGGFATPASQMTPSFCVGYNPDLKPHAYDLEKAKDLIKEAGAEGTELDIIWLAGRFPRIAELMEYLVDRWGEIGLEVDAVARDRAGWVDALYEKDPDKRVDLFILNHGNELGDSGMSISSYLIDSGRISYYTDPRTEELFKKSSTASYDERIKLLQETWAVFHEEQPIIDLFHSQWLFGMTDRLKWDYPRSDLLLQYKEMRLED